ncbi:MAG: SRPBCC domain-containing protein, partial [Actinomycetota bacterium]|nr:SRPBCC domain-containing protein [Actinomycetota bacterium]
MVADAADGTHPSGAVEISRILPATPDEVFRAWTDPEQLRQWMSPIGAAEAEVDPRVGGRLRIVMVGGGRRIEHTGEYLEVDPPRRLSFTWRSPFTGNTSTLVTILLTDHPEG